MGFNNNVKKNYLSEIILRCIVVLLTGMSFNCKKTVEYAGPVESNNTIPVREKIEFSIKVPTDQHKLLTWVPLSNEYFHELVVESTNLGLMEKSDDDRVHFSFVALKEGQFHIDFFVDGQEIAKFNFNSKAREDLGSNVFVSVENTNPMTGSEDQDEDQKQDPDKDDPLAKDQFDQSDPLDPVDQDQTLGSGNDIAQTGNDGLGTTGAGTTGSGTTGSGATGSGTTGTGTTGTGTTGTGTTGSGTTGSGTTGAGLGPLISGGTGTTGSGRRGRSSTVAVTTTSPLVTSGGTGGTGGTGAVATGPLDPTAVVALARNTSVSLTDFTARVDPQYVRTVSTRPWAAVRMVIGSSGSILGHLTARSGSTGGPTPPSFGTPYKDFKI